MHRTSTLFALAAAATAAHADTFEFFADLSADNEEPPALSPAEGAMTGTYDSDTNTFSFAWDIINLIGAPSAPGAHIHDGDPGVNGPIVFGFESDSWPTLGNASWTGMTSEQVDELFAGGYYINFHTDLFPGGEVRGQILLVPAPASLAMLGLGAPLALRRRR